MLIINFKRSEIWEHKSISEANFDTDSGIFVLNFQQALPMGKYPSIFQEKIYAIIICVRECQGRKSRGILIMFDKLH